MTKQQAIMRIYLDNNATTRVDDEVVEAMVPLMREGYGNASSIHTAGQEARAAIEAARRHVAALIGADTREVVFTSGGTESDNAALWGVFRSAAARGNHIVTTRIEHPAVIETCKAMAAAGAEVTFVPVDAGGRVDPAAVEAAITARTILVSVMLANNETGVLQPVAEIARVARSRGILCHTDAVQAFGRVPVDAGLLGVDLMSLSGHKFHGPKGVGALYIRKGTRVSPFITGGSHERKRRAGTENAPGIAGLGVAARLGTARLSEMSVRIAGLRDRLEASLQERVGGVRVNGAVEHRIPNTSNLSFQGIEGEAAVIALDLKGVAVSTGSACSSGSLEPSHVLVAMGLRPEVVQGSLRFSLSRYTTEAEIDTVIDAMVRVAERLRGLGKPRAI